MDSTENKPPILHIVVVGFHHKLGCQVEFSYPPLINGTTGKNECPSGWKYLPTLALPDGSHNYLEDTVYFNLPSLTEPSESIYGISCYRQISVEQLKVRTADMTRSTVQKSVCVLTRLPIYGYIEVKLSLIADSFFDKGDFSCTSLLTEAYEQLNHVLLGDETQRPLRHFYIGLSVRDIILQWRQKTLILLKLYMLQRRVIFFGSPVRGMCTLILCIASLIPRLLEKGFQEVACVRTSRSISPMPNYKEFLLREASENKQTNYNLCEQNPVPTNNEDIEIVKVEADSSSHISSTSSSAALHITTQGDESKKVLGDAKNNKTTAESRAIDDSINDTKCDRTDVNISREDSIDSLTSNLHTLVNINPNEYRAPISIFMSGNLCLPYLSLPYMDLLTDPSVLSYVIGTSNVLFQQKRQLADVHIDIENVTIEVHDSALRRQLLLSTEDLRFMDYILKHVHSPKEDGEGSENWMREQFQGYLLALLRTSVLSEPSARDIDHFNLQFMHAFKQTQCYQEWNDVRPEGDFFEALPVGHPFAGTISVADVKMKFAQTMQNTESGRKINQAVNTTSRAVGGAITQAKCVLNNWWSSIITSNTQTNFIAGSVESNDPQMDKRLSECEFPVVSNAIELKKTEISLYGIVDNKKEEISLKNDQQTGGIVEMGQEAESLNDKNKISANDSVMNENIFSV